MLTWTAACFLLRLWHSCLGPRAVGARSELNLSSKFPVLFFFCSDCTAMAALFRRANHFLFHKHLFLTNTAIGSGLLGAGDLIEQTIEIRVFHHQLRYDWPRAGRMAATGLLLGSVGHGWYKILDKRLPGTDRITVAKKVGYDLFVAGPVFAWIFFWGVGFLEKRPLKDIWSEFKVKFPYVFAFDCVLWPPVQAINFFYLPPRYRMVYVESVILFWNVVMSYIKHTNVGSKVG